MWSTVCTRVALLVTARLHEAIVAATTILSSRSPTTSTPAQEGKINEKQAAPSEKSEATPASKASSEIPSLRKRTAGAKADL